VTRTEKGNGKNPDSLVEQLRLLIENFARKTGPKGTPVRRKIQWTEKPGVGVHLFKKRADNRRRRVNIPQPVRKKQHVSQASGRRGDQRVENPKRTQIEHAGFVIRRLDNKHRRERAQKQKN